MIIKRLHDKVFIADVLFLISTPKEYEAWKKKVKLTGLESLGEEMCEGLSFKMDKTLTDGAIERDYVIWIDVAANFYTLLHETTHTVIKILDDRGIVWTKEDHEVLVYYQNYWFKRLWRIFGNLKKS